MTTSDLSRRSILTAFGGAPLVAAAPAVLSASERDAVRAALAEVRRAQDELEYFTAEVLQPAENQLNDDFAALVADFRGMSDKEFETAFLRAYSELCERSGIQRIRDRHDELIARAKAA